MIKKLFTPSDIERITGAYRHEPVKLPFYYAPPFLDQLRALIQKRLSSLGRKTSK